THVKTSVDVGRLIVVVPPNVALRVHGDADYGKVTLLGASSDGHDVNRTIDGGKADRVLDLDAHVGAGSLYVERAARCIGMPLPSFAASDDQRVIAGVCAGIAQALAVDVTLVRLVFTLLALAGGAGVVLYVALWVYGSKGKVWVTALLVLFAGSLLLGAIGLSDRSVLGIALVAGGLAFAWRRGGSFRPDAPLSYGGLIVAGAGAVLLLETGGATTTVLAPGAIAGALLLIGGPWLWRLALERDAERSARIRSDERSEVAARV